MKTKFLFSFLLCWFLYSCSPDSGGISGTGGVNENGGISGTGGPKLPPAETMGISDLPRESSQKRSYKLSRNTSHYDHAALVYDLIQTRIFGDIAVHAKLFSVLSNVTPQPDALEVYHWKSSETGQTDILEADLSAKGESSGYEWLLKVLDSNQIENILIEGLSDKTSSSGKWVLTKNSAEKLLEIEWVKIDQVLTVQYKNVSNSEHSGDIAILEIKGDSIKLQYADVSASKTVLLQWDSQLHSGSVKDPDFIDGTERFWDKNLDNINDADNF